MHELINKRPPTGIDSMMAASPGSVKGGKSWGQNWRKVWRNRESKVCAASKAVKTKEKKMQKLEDRLKIAVQETEDAVRAELTGNWYLSLLAYEAKVMHEEFAEVIATAYGLKRTRSS